MDHTLTITWAGQTWQLLGQKAMLWVETQTLILSDVHLGKAEDFQSAGIPVASQVHETDLKVLESLLVHHRPSRVWVLGDFVHSNDRELPHLAEAFKALRPLAPEWVLILGNHDLRKSERLAQWAFDRIVKEIEESDILFVHESQPQKKFQVQGHVHPVLKIVTSTDRLRLPCFLLRAKTLLLPAFGEFTGGFEVKPAAGDAIYLVADGEVLKWT